MIILLGDVKLGSSRKKEKQQMETGNGRAGIQKPAAKEYCILCGKLTDTEKRQPLTQRNYYIEGAGQLCRECYRELYVPRQDGNTVQISIMKN